ncbi:hypothetical protein GJ744_001341 [Endocarpon pusillum]|uniref:Cytochrome P450 n=1 Tax=Endocarpon pusillum TaxID=364733 RepID=A0A8H7ASV2_9EURO|nr:hypothetical protein GJ744_001341 [Endocarpon pusillum]
MALMDEIYQVLHQVPLALALPLSAIIGWRFWRFTLIPIIFPKEPKVLPYWIPIIGHTASFFKSADKTLTLGRQYFGDTREPFAITVAGTTIYVITSADDATVVLKNIESLTFDEYIRDMMLRFGTASAAVDAMWKQHSGDEPKNPKLMPNPLHKSLAHLQESILKQQLLPGNRFQSLSDKFLGFISNTMTWEQMPKKAIISESITGNYRIIGLLEWTQEVLLDSATRTFFGDQLIKTEPDLFRNFIYFDDHSWLFTYKIPKPWSKEMLAAKDVVQKALESCFDVPQENHQDAAWMITSLEDEMRALSISSKDIAAMINMIYWVVNGNAYKLCFWILAHLVYNPELFYTIKDEVTGAINAQTPVNELPERLDSCKQLDAVFHEVLRLISSSMAIRNVASPMEVGSKRLSKGTKVLIPFRQIHFNEAVWGKNAREFDPTRFTRIKAQEGRGASRDPNFRPFGGGTTICPGRFIARREVLAFIGLAPVRFEMTVDGVDDAGRPEDRQRKFPKLEEEKPCLGMMPPAQGENVYLRVAPGKR